jgi:hypothetical protein
MVLIAVSFIAGRKVAVLVSYATIIGGSTHSAGDSLLPFQEAGAESFPRGCKSLCVTFKVSATVSAVASTPNPMVLAAFPGPGTGALSMGGSPSAAPAHIPPLQGSAILRI